MKHLLTYGRVQFGIALIAFGIQHFIVQRFTIGNPPPWPASFRGEFLWAYLSGLVLIFTGGKLLLNKNARPFLMITAGMIFVWAFVRDLPVFFAHPVYNGFLTEMGEALMLTGCCLIVAGSPEKENKQFSLSLLGPVFIGVFLILCGTQHFTLTKYVQSLVPTWIPGGGLFWTYFAAVALIAGGIGLLWRRTRKLAAFWAGLMIFTWMLILHSFRVAADIHNADEWNSLIETAALSGALFVLASFAP